MSGIIKRNKWAIPYFSIPPMATDKYVAAINDLFFSHLTGYNPDEATGAILLGNPLAIKQMAEVAYKLTEKYDFPVILSGGPSPAYKKFGPEFIGCAAYEIINGTYNKNRQVPESVRARDALNRMLGGKPVPKQIILEGGSSNTYNNMDNSWIMMRRVTPYNMGPITIYTTIECLPRATETFKTVINDENVQVNAVPYSFDLDKADDFMKNWKYDYRLRSRIDSEARRLNAYSDTRNERIKNHIVLSDKRREQLNRVLDATQYWWQKSV